jgi:hypothetical protein
MTMHKKLNSFQDRDSCCPHAQLGHDHKSVNWQSRLHNTCVTSENKGFVCLRACRGPFPKLMVLCEAPEEEESEKGVSE